MMTPERGVTTLLTNSEKGPRRSDQDISAHTEPGRVSNHSSQPTARLRCGPKGIDVLSLGAGEPDFDTPSHISDCVIEAIRAGKTKYAKPASGTPEVKNAIIEKLRSQNGLEYDPSQIVVTVGGKEALWLAFRLDSGSRGMRSSCRRPTGSPIPSR